MAGIPKWLIILGYANTVYFIIITIIFIAFEVFGITELLPDLKDPTLDSPSFVLIIIGIFFFSGIKLHLSVMKNYKASLMESKVEIAIYKYNNSSPDFADNPKFLFWCTAVPIFLFLISISLIKSTHPHLANAINIMYYISILPIIYLIRIPTYIFNDEL